MKVEQIFGQSSKSQKKKPLISNIEIILGLLILVLMMLFFLASVSYMMDFKQNNTESLVTSPLSPRISSSIPLLKKQPPIQQLSALSNRKPSSIPQPQTSHNLTSISSAQTQISPKTRTPSIAKIIYQELIDEFQDDLLAWRSEILQTTLTIRFQNPAIFFEVGNSEPNFYYQHMLANFFPRYINVLKKYKAVIEAISIEGHTSSEWRSSSSEDEAYFKNMALSQARTYTVLEYCLLLPTLANEKAWLQRLLTANGLSSSRLIKNNNFENIEYSRRVEFRIYLHDKGELSQDITTNN